MWEEGKENEGKKWRDRKKRQRGVRERGEGYGRAPEGLVCNKGEKRKKMVACPVRWERVMKGRPGIE